MWGLQRQGHTSKERGLFTLGGKNSESPKGRETPPAALKSSLCREKQLEGTSPAEKQVFPASALLICQARWFWVVACQWVADWEKCSTVHLTVRVAPLASPFHAKSRHIPGLYMLNGSNTLPLVTVRKCLQALASIPTQFFPV